jgi:hypothetical protein
MASVIFFDLAPELGAFCFTYFGGKGREIGLLNRMSKV